VKKSATRLFASGVQAAKTRFSVAEGPAASPNAAANAWPKVEPTLDLRPPNELPSEW
jgi:hypothetical protein